MIYKKNKKKYLLITGKETNKDAFMLIRIRPNYIGDAGDPQPPAPPPPPPPLPPLPRPLSEYITEEEVEGECLDLCLQQLYK